MNAREQVPLTMAQAAGRRPRSAAPSQLQALADRGPQANRFGSLQAAADRSPHVVAQAAMPQMPPLQRAAPEEEEPLQARALQRSEHEGSELEEEEPLQARAVQRAPEEEEPLQGRAIQRAADATARPNRTGMPDRLKGGIEALSGHDISDVRVHANSSKPAQVGAHAYAQGSDIHLGPGQEKHLPHEAWHVVQQRQGRVQPTIQAHGVAINDDPALEQEADTMGARALQRHRSPDRGPA